MKLFESYLTKRYQSVRISEYVSNEVPVAFGVPQGSILGPTLFIIYINQLCDLRLPNTMITTYADDTALIFSGRSWEEVHSTAEQSLRVVAKWLKRNVLTLNVTKTKYIPFCITSKTNPDMNFQIKIHSCQNDSPNLTDCSCPNLMPADNIKYLGVYLDRNLRWDTHIHKQTARIRKLIYIFKNLRHVADENLIKTVYVSLVQSLIIYCLPIWGGAPKTHFIDIEIAQRCILKVMLFKPYRHPTNSLYQECKLLTVRQLYILHLMLYQHSHVDYTTVHKAIRHKRRKHKVCRIPQFKNKFTNRQLPFLSAFLYNKINQEINIFEMTKNKVKIEVSGWLIKKDYNETETLLKILN